MTLSEYVNRQVPEYYNWMHLDGFTPEQILHASSKQVYDNYRAKKEAEEVYVPNITFKSVVRIIK